MIEQEPKQRPKNQQKSRFPEQSLSRLIQSTKRIAGSFNPFEGPNHVDIELDL
jgi:hypothetical protein